MTIFYSPDSIAFYDTDIVDYPKLPDDCIEITKEKRDELIYEMNHKGNYPVLENGELVLKIQPIIVSWESVRLTRNGYLNTSDHTQIPDYPGDKEAWAKYRQLLRDLPQKFKNPEDVVWPEKPN